jgi:catechol 2,3-dioxygenase-like lactoylglutathione lyase family enzyme
MARFTGINHLHLIVRDKERAARFYEEAFGMKRLGIKRDAMIFLQTPGTTELLTVSELDPARAGVQGGFDHLGFRLADPAALDEAIEHVVRCGGRLVEKGELAPGIPTAFFEDPDGYRIQI